MSKELVLVTAPVETRSGYGNHSRDIVRALIDLDYDVKVNSVRWGMTPKNALEKDNKVHQEIGKRILKTNSLKRQPDLHLHLVVPNEFQPIGKKNVGMTAGIESTIPPVKWVEGMNRMDMNILTSEFSRHGFKEAVFEQKEQQGNKVGDVKVTKPMEVLFEGVDTDVYFSTTEISDEINEVFGEIDSNWNYLFCGHWLQGGMGQDRKDTGMLIKVFLETFKDKPKQPGLILKTSGAGFSVIDREEILKKIKMIQKDIKGTKLPPIYLIHGDFTDVQMNELYNHPKVKAHITFTHGEGFGRPLLEATQSGKPIVAPGWSGHLDFLNPNYSTLLNGSLTKVPREAFPNDIYFEGAQWFTVNYQDGSNCMVDIFTNYEKYLIKAKQLEVFCKKQFSYEKMRDKLSELIKPLLDSVPQKVELKLPKLKKVGE